MFRLELHEEARADLREAARWIREHSGISDARLFLETIYESFDAIVALPFAWPLAEGGARAKRLPSIRYTIAYLVRGDLVTVIAIAHMKRQPGYWLHRIQ